MNFASLIELELDFSQEDVEFANRQEFNTLLDRIDNLLKKLIDSFAMGNAIKNGIPIAIVGVPNVGKSTLLNSILNEERAIVSDIPGTTRDTVEDQITIQESTLDLLILLVFAKLKTVLNRLEFKKPMRKLKRPV